MSCAPFKILLIDGEEVARRTLGGVLERMGHSVSCAQSGEEGLRLFAEEEIDLVISDIQLPGMDGLELVRRLREGSAEIQVVLIAAHRDMDTAIEALKAGVFDLLVKPIELEELSACLQRLQRYQEVRREKEQLQRQLELLLRTEEGVREQDELIGESRAMCRVFALIERVAAADQTTVLIQGESGTGKELVARAIHQRSARAAGPFVGVNCTAIPENLLESELFGHERGAFTDAGRQRPGLFELGQGGTLFLDEIGEMSLTAQGKILRVLEERRLRRVGGQREIPVDVRLIAATNQNLQDLVHQGRFRQDLYFRIHVFTIDLPPLRSRGEDIMLLAHYFLRKYAKEFRKEIRRIAPAAQALLRNYPFPGNVRELRNAIERAVLLGEGSELRAEDLAELRSGSVQKKRQGSVIDLEQDSLDLNELECRAIQAALKRAGGKRVEAARLLGIDDDALRRRLKKYNLSG